MKPFSVLLVTCVDTSSEVQTRYPFASPFAKGGLRGILRVPFEAKAYRFGSTIKLCPSRRKSLLLPFPKGEKCGKKVHPPVTINQPFGHNIGLKDHAV